jgi:hypothetical protein
LADFAAGFAAFAGACVVFSGFAAGLDVFTGAATGTFAGGAFAPILKRVDIATGQSSGSFEGTINLTR